MFIFNYLWNINDRIPFIFIIQKEEQKDMRIKLVFLIYSQTDTYKLTILKLIKKIMICKGKRGGAHLTSKHSNNTVYMLDSLTGLVMSVYQFSTENSERFFCFLCLIRKAFVRYVRSFVRYVKKIPKRASKRYLPIRKLR